jgi:hypothetical protein
MGILYSENAFQFIIVSGITWFLRVVELERGEVNVDRLDEYLRTYLRDPEYKDVLLFNPILEDPVHRDFEFHAACMGLDGHASAARYRLVRYENPLGLPLAPAVLLPPWKSSLLALPRNGLRRIRNINLSIAVRHDLETAELRLKDITQRVGSGEIGNLSLNICIYSTIQGFQQVVNDGDRWLNPLRQWTVREASVAGFVKWWKHDIKLNLLNREWARDLPPPPPYPGNRRPQDLSPLSLQLFWMDVYGDWEKRVGTAWEDYLAREIMRPWNEPGASTDRDGAEIGHCEDAVDDSGLSRR